MCVCVKLPDVLQISVPRSDDPSDIVKIVGTKEGVDKARHIVQTIADEQVSFSLSLTHTHRHPHPLTHTPHALFSLSLSLSLSPNSLYLKMS